MDLTDFVCIHSLQKYIPWGITDINHLKNSLAIHFNTLIQKSTPENIYNTESAVTHSKLSKMFFYLTFQGLNILIGHSGSLDFSLPYGIFP